MTLESCLAVLRDEGKPLVPSKLAGLSAPSPEELTLFMETWAGIGIARRRQIISRLTELAEENPVFNFDDIFRACLDDSDEEVRAKAIEGLWECEERSLIEPFIALLRQDSEGSVRAAAAMALGRFALLAELEKLRPEDGAKVQDALLLSIEDEGEELEVRRRAIEAIAHLSLSQVSELIHRAYDSDDVKMRASAIYAMGMNSDPVWLPILLRELSSPYAELRFEATVACGEFGDEEAVPHLVSLIQDSDDQVQLSAIVALGQIGGSEAEQALRGCLKHHDEQICQAAREALEEIEVEKEPFSFRFEL